LTSCRRLKGGFGGSPPRLKTPLAFFYFLLSLRGFGGPPPRINTLLFKLSPLLKVTGRWDLLGHNIISYSGKIWLLLFAFALANAAPGIYVEYDHVARAEADFDIVMRTVGYGSTCLPV
jgi:hypothetical protein